MTPALAKQLGYEHQHGVVVTRVDEDGLAALAGLRPKDLIVEADRQKVNSVADLENAMTKANDQGGLLLLVKREGASLFILLRKG